MIRRPRVIGPDGYSYPAGTTFSSTPRPAREIATDESLAIAALDNQLRSASDEADDFVMTQDKLEAKLPGMGAAALQLADPNYARFRLEDEEIIRAEQARYREGKMSDKTQTHLEATQKIVSLGGEPVEPQQVVLEDGTELLLALAYEPISEGFGYFTFIEVQDEHS